MNPLLILVVGMAVVVGGILIFRLHAFLALVAGALAVAVMTPGAAVERFVLRGGAATVVSAEGGKLMVRPAEALPAGTTLEIVRLGEQGMERVGLVRLMGNGGPQQAVAAEGSGYEAGDFVVDATTAAEAEQTARATIGERVATGFGLTARDIGVLLAMASILGKSLIDSGAAETIVRALRRALGERHIALAFLIGGFSLAGLVLADTTFYMLIPLAQAMAVRTKRDYTLYILAIAAGATMTHSLVPPSPGPVILATELRVPLIVMIGGGLAVGAIASSAGYLYALWANVRWKIPVRMGLAGEIAAMKEGTDGPKLPLGLALLPIAAPVGLIALRAVAESGKWGISAEGMRVITTLGEKNLALVVGAVLGLLLVAWRRKREDGASTRETVTHGLTSGGVMVLIIAAGGAFGLVLRQTDIGAAIREWLPVSKLALIPLAFLMTTALRTAQGSATVAIVTAAGIVSPIALAGGLGFHPVYLALAIGCGAKPGMWMNDAGFWIIGKVSGFTEAETLKTATVMMTIMGLAGLGATVLGAWLLPMAGG
ncbi:MAG TPA: SLC13 family permease [Phycisphaerae bacterium]|nr:SLC13 family permease [Phycisphaerae bacterium]